MTILHISAVKSWGGGENHIENLCFELTQSNPEVINVVLCVKDQLFHQRLSKTNIITETAPLSINLDLRFALKIIRMSRKYKANIIHLHDPSAIVLAILADKFFSLPPFVFSKKTSFPIKNKKLTLYKYNYSKIKKYLCVSEETKRITAEAIVDNDKLITIYHGTNIGTKDSLTPFLLREKFGIDSSKKIIGIIGNHIRAKNFETLIETVNIIVNIQKKTDYIFIQIGSQTDRSEDLLQSVKNLNLEKNILFLGYMPNASNFIPQFDTLLLTSQSEGIPQVIYESFYHKIPVISTNVGGIPEIVQDGINGLLAPKQKPEILAQKIEYLFNNEHLISDFVAISKENLLKYYTTSIMAQKTLQEYKTILNGN
ncbi:glycosyltransferase family 4 protein [Flavobacterium sp. DSP2-3-1]|uniref:glycosyltransferase family 4 protein n=1 Tax=Flavobacterium sp. DSP2-3-1 TaxID=2804620 RepID=UPI003CED8114